MNPQDPPRLHRASDSPPALAEALRLARSELPARAELGRLASSLDAEVASESRRPSRRPPSMRPLAASAAGMFKMLLAAVVAATGLSVAIVHYRSADRPAAIPDAPSKSADPPAERARTTNPLTAAHETAEMPALDDAPAKAARPSTSERTDGIPRADTAPRAVASSRGDEVQKQPSAASFPEATGLTEVALLGRAQHELVSDPGSALSATEEHARRYPSGALLQEREFIAIQALVRLGRRSEAATRAAQFRSRFPESAHLRRIDILLGQ